ncbi:regulatory protein, luxR family [Sphingobium sp. AP50]|uniref:helix-turn-helix transcriptional regulator n=1 Tax=Sphingobium sp. AP50 TaxID=1884369 RepID=UPI0008AED8BC|nr:helix-turn-helix transcriptional regulator [Sphingobium sp. AP50]SEJ28424.1 regulatory protein, luxR family [Sphingobium sp. AP50]
MQLTSADETDLLMPLYAGVHDQSRWQSFLARLQRRTGADHAALILGRNDAPMDQATEISSGRNLREEADKIGLARHYAAERLPYRTLRPGRVYGAAELVLHDAAMRSAHQHFNEQLGVSDRRVIRIRDQEGASAWLSLARNDQSFSASDGALLIAVAPHVAVALRNFVQTEGLRIQATMAQHALARGRIGWIAFDQDARIVARDEAMAALLPITTDERLRTDRMETRQMLLHMAAEAANAANNAYVAPRVVTLLDTPHLDAVLVPLPDSPAIALATPVLLALCRLSPQPGEGRAALLAELFDLPRREAELALAISDGLSIAEAATLLGLTQETARNYSKRIYARMGVRGQAELVRRVLLSNALLG